MKLQDRSKDNNPDLTEQILQAVTDIPMLNSLVTSYVEDKMDLEEGTDPMQLEPQQQQYYWDLYGLKTKEYLLHAITQL